MSADANRTGTREQSRVPFFVGGVNPGGFPILVVAAALLLTAGCGSVEQRDPFAPIVLSSGSGAEALTPEEEEERNRRFESILADAEQAAVEGRSRDAMSIAQTGLEGNPPARVRSKLLTLRRQVKEDLFKNEIVAGRCVIEADSFVIGAAIPVRVELSNLGDEPVVIPATHRTSRNRKIGGESTSLLQLRVSVQDWDWHGSTVTQDRLLNLPLDEDVEILPGGSWSTEVTVETDDPLFRPELVVYRRLTTDGKLQPVEIRSGELQWFSAVSLAADTCEVLPKGVEKLRAAPRLSLERALELSGQTRAALNHVFFSSILLYAEQPEVAVRYLLEGLSADDAGRRQVSLTVLRLVTGRTDLIRAGDWEAWVSDRFGDVAEPR